MLGRATIVFGLGLTACSAARAAETITYTYDARGRVVAVQRTGSVNNNVNRSYTIDKANNRNNKTTTGSPNPPT